MSKEKFISTITMVYFMAGFLFTIVFAIYYRWPPLSFLSPSFYSVIFTWPYQAIGFIRDLLNYGLAGKPI
ncbi:hypothetical protein A3B45_01105 [Candidatus Daviesbacteria bacterium RIFCSPLOWO2_01_FULL_39_12]|uniref:Uncharacterized protein n=1 Tax=Candidatus Daviesbacteria bacterium RIFCSPLOWO2_01_FULL_39_12 TaxID=1797785 RepID=A0A1F5KQC7_9BACT|nr:MAG: hypothetical protein A3B45_01105 [Candidatus Daviesbacteria bacterium RIFCSPLOWO2_01_FULL_39_12]